VIGEITGRRKPREVVVIGGHLDSWDLGTGAIDDGAGVGITMAAGHLIGALKQAPKRSIRVIAFANEEQGLYGGRAYAEAHLKDVKLTRSAPKATSGPAASMPSTPARPRRKARAKPRSRSPKCLPARHRLPARQGRAGTGRGPVGGAGHGLGLAGAGRHGLLRPAPHRRRHARQDRPEGLAQNVAAYAVFAYLAAEADGSFGSEAKDVVPPRE
jgi:hypothetical protein